MWFNKLKKQAEVNLQKIWCSWRDMPTKNQPYTLSFATQTDFAYYSSTKSNTLKTYEAVITILLPFFFAFIYSILSSIKAYSNASLLGDLNLSWTSIIGILFNKFFPFIFGLAWLIYLIKKYKFKTLFSGILPYYLFVCFRILFFIPYYSILFKVQIIGANNLSQNDLDAWSNYVKYGPLIDLIYNIITIIISISITFDSWRGFLLIFLSKYSVDRYLTKTFINSNEELRKKHHFNPYFWPLIKIVIFIGIVVIFTTIATRLGIIGSYLSNWINSGKQAVNQSIINSRLQEHNLLIVVSTYISIVLTAPIMEEFAVRAGIFSVSNNRAFGAILSGFLFGFMHLHDEGIGSIFPYLFFGAVISLQYFFIGNIWVGIAIHMANNIGSVISH